MVGTEFADASVQRFLSHCSSSLSRYCILARVIDWSVLNGRRVLWLLFHEESMLTAENTHNHLTVSASTNSRCQWKAHINGIGKVCMKLGNNAAALWVAALEARSPLLSFFG